MRTKFKFTCLMLAIVMVFAIVPVVTAVQEVDGITSWCDTWEDCLECNKLLNQFLDNIERKSISDETVIDFRGHTRTLNELDALTEGITTINEIISVLRENGIDIVDVSYDYDEEILNSRSGWCPICGSSILTKLKMIWYNNHREVMTNAKMESGINERRA